MEAFDNIPIKVQVIVSLIFIPLMIFALNKAEHYQEVEKEAFNKSFSAESRAASADYRVDEIQSRIIHLKYNIENIPKEAEALERRQDYVRSDAILAHQRGWISLEEANRRIDKVNAEMIALQEKYREACELVPKLESELITEQAAAKIRSQEILDEGERAEAIYPVAKQSGDNWVLLAIACAVILFFFCTPFRWFIYLILAVVTFGAILKMFNHNG